MGTTLDGLSAPVGANRPRTRVGRGLGSGHGETAGRGVKGQKARAGHHGARMGFEGGQMPMQRRLPKRGFNNKDFRQGYSVINVGEIAARFPDGVVDPTRLADAGMVPRRAAERIKVLGEGEIATRLTVKAHAFSDSARKKIEEAGGTVEILKS